MRKLLKKYGFVPDKLVTDNLRSYAAAAGQSWDRKTPRAWSMAQQSSREFASTDPTTRIQDAGFQVSGVCPKISLNSRSDLQHFQRPTSSHFCKDTPSLPVSLPKSRFEHTDDGGRQGSDAQQRLRSARSIAYRARPCQVKHGFAPRYNRWRMAQESGEGPPR